MKYDPLTDPAADGFVDLSKQAWKAGASGLDAANAAPLAPESDRNRLKKWLWVVGLLVAFVLGWTFYSKHQTHKAAVNAIKTAPFVLPETVVVAKPAQSRKAAPKDATNKIAIQAINTPAMPSFEATKPVKKESSTDDPLAPALAEFDKQVINFESKL